MKSLRIILAVCASILATFTVSASGAVLTVDELNANGEQYIGKSVTVNGLCSHLCSHGGRKMFLRGAKTLIRVESTDATGAFPQEVVNRKVSVTGHLCETRIDETYLRNWEARLSKPSGSHDGCETESKARGDQGNTDAEKIASFRKRIAERSEKEGKAYLSTFYIVAESYRAL